MLQSPMTSSTSESFPEIREGVRALCANYPGAYWRELDARRAYPEDFVKELTAAGYLAALIPEDYGGSGLPLAAGAAILEEIQKSGCNGAACHAQMYTMGTVLRHGSAAQKQRYLPAIAEGSLRLQAFGVTEPTSGTDTLSLSTTARREGDRYVVNGQKVWTSRAEHSDLMLLLARTTPKDEVKKKGEGLSVFIVDRAAALFDVGQHCGKEANMAKMLASEASWAAAEACLQTHGGFGFAEEYDVERKYREARLYQVAPISTNLILAFLAEHVLGMPRSY